MKTEEGNHACLFFLLIFFLYISLLEAENPQKLHSVGLNLSF